MCSELFRIPYSVGGVPIFGVGLLLALWAIASAVTLTSLIRRHGWGEETFGSLPALVLLGAAILFLPRVFPEGLPIRGYGVFLLLGIISGVGLAMHLAQKGGLPAEVILSLAIWMVVCGIIGARLFFVVEYWNDKFAGLGLRDTLLEIINIPEGGLVIFGGFLGAAAGFVAFVRRHKLPLLALADLVSPCMMVGLAFGRVGCLMNGCCYGGQTDLPWHVTFPKLSSPYEAGETISDQRLSPPYADQASRGELHGFRIDPGPSSTEFAVVTRVDPNSPAAQAGLVVGDSLQAINGSALSSTRKARNKILELFLTEQPLALTLRDGKRLVLAAVPPPERSRPVHPTQLYSAVDAALLAWLLWAFLPYRSRDGQAIALLLTVHPVTRFLLEIIRTDEPAVFGTGLSISQNVSVGLLAAGLALWWHLSRKPQGITWPLSVSP